jgi:DNA-binding winged helix-turn-helix (wHTH) protein
MQDFAEHGEAERLHPRALNASTKTAENPERITSIRKIYAFDRFTLDPRERRLIHAGDHVALAPKVLDTLIVLVQNAGSLLSKEELHRRLWSDTFVEDVTLARSISDLRTALGRFSESKYIETVPKHGYRFVSGVNVTEGVSAPEMSSALDSIAILPF